MARKEPVRVAVIFAPGKGLRPIWFDRHRQKHVVKDVTYTWQDRVGEKPLLHFAVTDGEALYELIYSILDSSWVLVDQKAVQ